MINTHTKSNESVNEKRIIELNKAFNDGRYGHHLHINLI